MENNPEFTENQAQDEIPFTNMSGDWMPWERGLSGWRSRKKLSRQDKKKKKLSKKEYRAAVSGMYLAMLPVLLCVLVAFGLVYLIITLWLM
ncbi:MAG: hypothetical protein K2K80_06415 [Clostridia bacterium]|nr:hypothetical protein [Clostridia bacterium]